MPTVTQLASGLGGAIGSDFRPVQKQLVFVEFNGKLSRLNLFPTATVVSSGTAVLKGTWTFDFDTGIEGGVGPGFDVWWEQVTAVNRQMAPQNSARIVNLGVVNFATINAASLQGLPYSTTPIDGNNDPTNKLVPGDVFAVHTTNGNYAKVEVITYGYDLHIQWVTYHLDPAYAVLGTGYNEPEDVKVSVDGIHAYVTERTGDLLRVALTSANRAAATVVTSGMATPHQIALDEAHNAAYVVEFGPSGRLLRVDLTSGIKSTALSGLNNAVGLVLSSDLQFAYISEQMGAPNAGRVSSYRLSDGAQQTIASSLTSPFFLTWLDAAQTSLLVPQRDPANSVDLINIVAGSSQIVASGLPTRPSSVALPSPSQMLVCSDQVISSVDLSTGPFQPAGPLLMGIGFIPFDRVTAAGLADTTVDPAYFYQRKDTPFGGTLPIMVNHLRAFEDGAVYYRVKVDGSPRTDSWTDEKWNGFHNVAVTTNPITIAGQPGYFPVHPLSELFLWMNPSLGLLTDSTNLTNGLHTILLDFVDGLGGLIEQSTPLTIRVDNNYCVAAVAPPTLNGSSADPTCGLLKYVAKNSDPVIMAFTASQPNDFATFSFTLIKGVNAVALPAVPPTSGPVSTAVSPITGTVSGLLGTCDIAGFGEWLYVAATIDNGWGRQGQYDAQAAVAFVLAP